ncbi:MAG: hypothetical protein M1812_001198 [Candelaria pacifica]|nr:MAG: hypothetical protein M1812_001198 [Candelaria pacifica]
MMFSGFGVTDLLSVTQLAWTLYHNCYLVAREAPDEFRQLVNELASLQGVLRTLRDDVNSDKSFLDRLGENRKGTLERCLASCYETLKNLEKLVLKYRQLGIGDGLQFWRKIKWVTQQRDVSNLRAKIMVHTCNISLCMSSIGNSSLARIETSLVAALDRQQDVGVEGEGEETVSPLARSKTTDTPQNVASDGLGLSGLQRRYTSATLVGGAVAASPESTPSLSEEDASEFGGSSAATPTARKGSMSSNFSKRKPSSSMGKDSRVFPPSPPAISEDGFDFPSKNAEEKQSASNVNAPNVMDVVAEAMKELSQIRQREQTSRPLRIVPQDAEHRPDDSLKRKFQELANDELKVRRLNARDWLRVATWWLLKARNTMELHERPALTDARGSFSPSTDSRSPSSQAYVDLLKASWILYEIILNDENLTPLLTDENRKLFYNLSDAINEDFYHFRPVDIPDKHTLHRQNLNIWELLQPEEENFEEDDLLPGLENSRWITVEQEDAGEEDEQVLFRTFVNAEIGSKALRMKSRGAPYLLILSTKEGDSEPKVTICNQSGTLGLTRDFTPNDVADPSMPSSPISGLVVGSTQPLPLHFGRMRVSVGFTSENDLNRFMYIPEAYFRSVQKREPRQLQDATETLIFRSSLEIFEILKASTMKPTLPRQSWNSCDLRVLETTGKEGWRTTRRLVVSSSAGDRRPWCQDFFIPLSRVQTNRDPGSRQVVAKWSDCTHEVAEKTDGNWNKIWSYVYDDSNPNIAVNLQFRTQADAADFERHVLQLNLPALFSWSAGSDGRFVYDIADTDPNPKNYKALLITHTRHSWKYSELFYMYRDADYQYDHSTRRVRFPQVYYTDYISNHAEKLYKPPADNPPAFSHCQKKVGNAPIEFDEESVSQAFMSSLTLGHELVFSRKALWITTKAPSRFGSSKSNKGSAEIQLWRKGNGMRLVSRWEDKVEDKWLTMAVPRSHGLASTRDSNRAQLPQVEYNRGRLIDMANLVARSPRVKEEAKKVGPIVIAFESVRDREEFAAALDGTEVPRRTSGVLNLLDMM